MALPALHPSITFERLQPGIEFDDMQGFCVFCGEEADQPVEPDASKYRCSSCGKRGVYGASELLFHLS